MYFGYSFHQHYLGKDAGGLVLDYAASGTPADLTKGQLGLYTTDAQGLIGSLVTATSGTTQNVTLVQGSWHTVDQIGQGLAGYQVPLYSKTINWKNVTQFVKTTGYLPQNQILSIGWDYESTGSSQPEYFCGQSYYLKIEGLGEPALTFLNKQIYNNLDAWGGCCGSECSSGCTSTSADATTIYLQWSDRIKQNPYLPSFVAPAVYTQNSTGSTAKTRRYSAYDVELATQGKFSTDPAVNAAVIAAGVYVPNLVNPGSVVACLQLTVAYVNTEFNDCSFSFTDRYIYEPLYLQASLLTQNGDPCSYNATVNSFVPEDFVTQIQAPRKKVGGGEDIIRAFIGSNRYRQYNFPDNIYANSIRMREVEDDVSFNVDRTAIYDQLMLLFNVDRNYNPTSIHSNDQYAIIIDVLHGTNISTIQSIISGSLAAVGSNVTLKTYTAP
jgi:hypothetical protein